MKQIFFGLFCLSLCGCGFTEKQRPESDGRLDALSKKLDVIQAAVQSRGVPVRWAYLNRARFTALTADWNRRKLEEAEQNENFAPEVREKLAEFDRLNEQLRKMQQNAVQTRTSGSAPVPPLTSNPEFLELRSKVVELSNQLADVLKHRAQLQAHLRYPLEALVAEYARGRYDLVLDNSQGAPYIVLHENVEVPDITEAIIRLLKQKDNPTNPEPAAKPIETTPAEGRK